jgi:hypothetical protein
MPSIDLEIADFKDVSMKTIEVENQHYSWKSCCLGSTDSRLLKLLFTYATLGIVLIFSITMLLLSDTCEQDTTYMSLLMFTIGLLIPTNK